jgi:hypothetical protein
MKGRYDFFGFLMIVGFAAILIATAVALVLKGRPLGDTLFLLGVLVIVSFFIMVLVEGTARHIPRNEIKVPWLLAVLTLILAAGLFVAGAMAGITW